MTVPFSDSDPNWPSDDERRALLDVFTEDEQRLDEPVTDHEVLDDLEWAAFAGMSDEEWARNAPRQTITLSAEDYDKLEAMLAEPPQDSSKLRKLFQRPRRIFKDT